MIKIENITIHGIDEAMRGMRNPKNSWVKADTKNEQIGPNDLKLAETLASAGPVHGKYRRMITVYMDITAPLYWWKEFDTYKVGTVADSCSTMHKIADKEFELSDFSHDHIYDSVDFKGCDCVAPEIKMVQTKVDPYMALELTVDMLNVCRKLYLETNDKIYWWQMIQLLPSSYNQKRTVMMNYEVLNNIYTYRRDHKLDEWRQFCKIIETLPYFNEIIRPFEYVFHSHKHSSDGHDAKITTEKEN